MATQENKLVIFRFLSLWNLLSAVYFRLTGRQIVYIEPIGTLRTKKWSERLTQLGINRADYHSYEEFPMCGMLLVIQGYAERLIDSLFSESDFIVFARMIPGDHANAQTARSLLFNSLFKEMEPYGLAYCLAEYFVSLGKRADVFQPRTTGTMLISMQGVTEVRNLYPGWAVTFIVLAFKSLGHLHFVRIKDVIFRLLFSNKSIMTSSKAGAPDIKATAEKSKKSVIYFPHKGPTFGSLYVKDQYYSLNPLSPFHMENIQHIEINLTEKESVSIRQAYQQLGISVTFVTLVRATDWRNVRLAISRFWRTADGKGQVPRLKIILQCLTLVHRFRLALKPFEGARIALLGYDVLFPKAAVVALQSMEIKVIAAQERFIMAFYPYCAPILDLYFVHGEISRVQIEGNRNSAVNEISVIGDVRREKLPFYRKQAVDERAERFSKFTHVCLVLDYHTLTDPFEDPSSFWTDIKCNQFFYSSIANLAESRPSCMFIVRGKDARWLEIDAMAPSRKKFEALENVEVDSNYDSYDRTYKLAAMSDIVVARHTSLGDQCLAAGIPVLFYEAMPNGGKLVSEAWHDYKPYPVFVYDEPSLLTRFGQVIKDGDFMEEEMFREMRKRYYNVESEIEELSPQASLLADLEQVHLSGSCELKWKNRPSNAL